jgi:hypothetical protein
MRPKYAMWSEYGTSSRKHWMSPARRSTRRSVGPKLFLVAALAMVGVIGIGRVYPQVFEGMRVQSAADGRLAEVSSERAPPTTIPAVEATADTLPPQPALALAAKPAERQRVTVTKKPAVGGDPHQRRAAATFTGFLQAFGFNRNKADARTAPRTM